MPNTPGTIKSEMQTAASAYREVGTKSHLFIKPGTSRWLYCFRDLHHRGTVHCYGALALQGMGPPQDCTNQRQAGIHSPLRSTLLPQPRHTRRDRKQGCLKAPQTSFLFYCAQVVLPFHPISPMCPYPFRSSS